jgi:hypothetical protein
MGTVLKYPYTVVGDVVIEKDLMVKFGIKPSGYDSHDANDVTAAFNALHAYINDSTKFTTETDDTTSDVVHLGDYIDLASLNVVDWGGGGISTTNIDLAPNGKLLRLIVVGINSMNRRLGNPPYGHIDTPHIIFQFQNLPGLHRMNATRDNTTGYEGSEARAYLTTRFMLGLTNAGVPEDLIWHTQRRVWQGYGKTDNDAIVDAIWLPTEREIFNANSSSNSSYETAGNQAYLEYYDSTEKRKKYLASNISKWYWLASPYYNSAQLFACISGGVAGGYYADDETFGVAPAFCIK